MELYRNKSYKGDCIELMKHLPDESIDVVLTDPPYLYLEKQKLERPFDEWQYFKEVRRVLKPNGFIVLFGRGSSFYRWNTILAEMPEKETSIIKSIKSFLGRKSLPKAFKFKEEIIWNKRMHGMPSSPIARVHETVSIHSKGKSVLNKVKVDYIEQKQYDVSLIASDIKKIRNALNDKLKLEDVSYFLETGQVRYEKIRSNNQFNNSFGKPNAAASLVKVVQGGMKEKSIIEITRESKDTKHPTQKPVRLLERLLALVCKVEPDKPKPVVLDTFRGSASTDIACMNFGCDYISFEIDDEYFEAGENRKIEYIINKLNGNGQKTD